MRWLLAGNVSYLTLLLLASPVQADLLFSQPAINGGIALASDFARSQQEADNFTLAQSASVQSVQWWGAYASNGMPTDNFTLRFFADAAGNPAMTPFVNVSLSGVTRTATNLLDNLGDRIYAYQATLPSSVLVGGAATYYLSLVNNTGDWDWVGSGSGTHWARQDDASAWTVSSNATSFAFELLGTAVPEPSTLLLLTIGTLGLIGGAWWRRGVSWTRSRGDDREGQAHASSADRTGRLRYGEQLLYASNHR